MGWLRSLSGLAAFISVCLGLVFYVFLPNLPWLTAVTWSAAIGFSVLWLFLDYKSVLRFLTQKSTRYGANLLLIVFLVLGILVFANILARDYNWRKDITRLGSNTLSEQSKKILHELNQQIKIIYLSRDEQRDAADNLLRRYTYESKNLSYEVLNPNRFPTRVRALGIDKIENDLVVLTLGDKKVVVQGLNEEKITNGLVKLLKTKNQTIGFAVGHGERLLEAPEGSTDSIGLLKAEIEKEAYATKPVNLFAEGKVAPEISVLVVLGPKSSYFPKELEILKDWLDKGGRALIGIDLDPKVSGLSAGSKQIADLLKNYGVSVGTKLLVDPTSRAANVEPQILMAYAATKDHLITKDFPTSTVGLVANFLFPLTARLTKAETPIADTTITALAKTTASAWEVSDWASVLKGAVNFKEGKDFKGAMDLAYAVEKKNGPRLVIFGTSSLAIDSLLNVSGNRDLILNSIAWLSDNSDFISIRAKDEANNDRLQIDANLLGLIRLLVIFILPVSTMVLGIWVWHRRRGR